MADRIRGQSQVAYSLAQRYASPEHLSTRRMMSISAYARSAQSRFPNTTRERVHKTPMYESTQGNRFIARSKSRPLVPRNLSHGVKSRVRRSSE